MHVDKSRSEETPISINFTSCPTEGSSFGDFDNDSIANPYICGTSLGPRAIDEVSISKHKVIHVLNLPSRTGFVQVFSPQEAGKRKRAEARLAKTPAGPHELAR
jgi:hypothetical protein